MGSKIKLIFLGTADQIPSLKRNHSAMLLVRNEENILIDCGEGTQRQFRKARLNPCKVTRILLTHIHGDHVLGLPGLLSTMALSGYNKELFIYGPKGIKKFIDDMLKLFNFRREYKINVEEVSGVFFDDGVIKLEAEKMKHGVPCNAYSFVEIGQRRLNKEKMKKLKLSSGPFLKDLKEGKDVVVNGKKFLVKDLTYIEDDVKISFVLDTKNNSLIIPFVRDSDLFICESAYSDELKKEAEDHGHLTAKQCGEIAKKSKANKMILTHLSQRYEYNKKKILEEAKKGFDNTVIAKDLDEFDI